MTAIHVTSEIGKLKKVLLHRPGRELLNLTPDTLERLLFDDIPFLKVAQEEHDAFAKILRDNGVEVVYLEDLMAETLAANPGLREQFLKQFIDEAGIKTEKYKKIVYDFLNSYDDNKELPRRRSRTRPLRSWTSWPPRTAACWTSWALKGCITTWWTARSF